MVGWINKYIQGNESIGDFDNTFEYQINFEIYRVDKNIPPPLPPPIIEYENENNQEVNEEINKEFNLESKIISKQELILFISDYYYKNSLEYFFSQGQFKN